MPLCVLRGGLEISDVEIPALVAAIDLLLAVSSSSAHSLSARLVAPPAVPDRGYCCRGRARPGMDSRHFTGTLVTGALIAKGFREAPVISFTLPDAL